MKSQLLQFLLIVLFFIGNSAIADPPFPLPSASQLKKIRGAIIRTTAGDLYVRLYPKDAPWHVANFKYLADRNYYRNAPFHIFQKDYLAQTGAANSDPASGPKYSIPAEFNERKHQLGSLSMVRKPDFLDVSHSRNSHSSQFRILLADAPHMDGQFTVFGKVIKGIDILSQLLPKDRIINIQVFVKE
jgi:cyclophilin family peptidyl-prolyl cis-trans isomerase